MLKVYLENTVVGECVLVVKGDVTGDGKVNISDVSKLYQALKGIVQL